MTTRERVAQAVDDEKWQAYRLDMKGEPTHKKLEMLRIYWNANIHGHVISKLDTKWDDVFAYDCDICIRVDNYIKALCRGGQLYAGESLFTALDAAWLLRIKK